MRKMNLRQFKTQPENIYQKKSQRKMANSLSRVLLKKRKIKVRIKAKIRVKQTKVLSNY